MKALQVKFKATSVSDGKDPDMKREELALLDGGATHALRQARDSEKEGLWEVEVELALGTARLYRHENTSALLTLDDVEPIIPLRMLVESGFSIKWGKRGCVIEHPAHGRLTCWLRHGCPVMNRGEALRLLDFLDDRSFGRGAVVNYDWWRKRFPDIPDEVLSFMGAPADLEETGKRSPFNRRLRRRWESGKGIVLHLFSGRDGKKWRSSSCQGFEVVTVDIDEDPRQDLHDVDLWGYLWRLSSLGMVRAIIGGPPCRTVSRLRHSEPGPRPLRGRGANRWALPGLDSGELRKVHGDSALLLKQLGLWYRAEEAREGGGRPVGFLLESPTDPAEYLGEAVLKDMPSYWEFPEMQELCRRGYMELVKFDQGALGHQRRKPTTVATNLPGMGSLHGLRGGGPEAMATALPERLHQTKTWAQWAPGLVDAVRRSLAEHLREVDLGSAGASHIIKGMSLEAWKEHVERGHVPFQRRCRVCLEQAGIDRQHRRQRLGVSSYVMNVDVIGPFVVGEDVGTRRRVKYALVSTVPIPVKPTKVDPGEPDAVAPEDGALDPGEDEVLGAVPMEGLEGSDDSEPLQPEDQERVTEKLRAEMKDMLSGYEVQNLTMVEPMESRETGEVLRALGMLYTRYRALGIPLYRLHGDRARELISKGVQRWCLERDLRLTVTGGDDHAANGRIEAEICQVKRRMRICLGAAKAPLEEWPMALRHAVHQRHQVQMKALGMEAVMPLPYRSLVMVKLKRWHKGGGLETPFVAGQLLGPSPHMHVGWIVRTAEGNIQHAHTVVHPDPLASQAILELEAVDTPDLPTHRIHEKTPLHGPRPAPGAGGESSSSGASSSGAVRRLGGEKESEIQAMEWCANMKVEEYINMLESQHWGLRLAQSEELQRLPQAPEEGAAYGAVAEMMQGTLELMEASLRELQERKQGEVMRLCSMQKTEADMAAEQQPGASQQKVLQTYTVPLATVKKSLDEWIPSIQEEYIQLTEKTGTIQRITEAEAKQMPGYGEAEFAPCKMVNTIKAPHGRHRSRIVLCGNLVEAMHAGQEREVPSKQDLYAGGIVGVALRCALRRAAHHGWSVGSVDVKTAFLLAPRTKSHKMLLSRPPRLLVDCGICGKDELWMVNTAMYGLDTSPADWSCYRDAVLKGFKWTSDSGVYYELQETPETNLWTLWRGQGDERKAVGNLVVYVDDLLVLGDDSASSDLMTKILSTWKCSDPEWVNEKGWVKFCGFEIRRHGNSLLIGQPSYIKELIKRHQITTQRTVPFAKQEGEEPEENVDPATVKAAQGIVGELLWVSIRTRPDIAYGVSQLSQAVSRRPQWVVEEGIRMLEYLAGTTELCLEYARCPEQDWGMENSLAFPRSMQRMEIHADASFSPNGTKSHHGIMAFVGGGLVQWESTRQPFAVLSSAEAELMGYIEGMVMGDSVAAVLECLDPKWSDGGGHRLLYGDNQAAIAILTNVDGAWRTRHLRLRAYFLRERIKDQVWTLRHLSGSVLVADFLTKAIVVKGAWETFKESAKLKMAELENLYLEKADLKKMNGTRRSDLTKLAGLALATGAAIRAVGYDNMSRFSLVALVCGLLVAGRRLTGSLGPGDVQSEDPRNEPLGQTKIFQEKGPREHEPEPKGVQGPRDHEPAPERKEPKGHQEKTRERGTRENEPVPKGPQSPASDHCPAGFLGRFGVGRLAMMQLDTSAVEEGQPANIVPISEESGRPSMVGLKAFRLRRSFNDSNAMASLGPWREEKYSRPPSRVSDTWEETSWMGHVFHVRVHGVRRKSLFHPLHSRTPVQPDQLMKVRHTIMFFGDGTIQKKSDYWMTNEAGTTEEPWTGFTFFALHSGETEDEEEVQENSKSHVPVDEVLPTKGKGGGLQTGSRGSSSSGSKGYQRGKALERGKIAAERACYHPKIEVAVTVNTGDRVSCELGNSSAPDDLQMPFNPASVTREDDESTWEEVGTERSDAF